jgi:hypothetical protein
VVSLATACHHGFAATLLLLLIAFGSVSLHQRDMRALSVNVMSAPFNLRRPRWLLNCITAPRVFPTSLRWLNYQATQLPSTPPMISHLILTVDLLTWIWMGDSSQARLLLDFGTGSRKITFPLIII